MRFWLIALLWLGSLSSLTAQFDSDEPGLFDSDDVLEMTLKTDFVALMANRTEYPEDFRAELSYPTTSGEVVDVPLKVRLRGRSRRDPAYCDFPPLKLDFDKDDDLPAPFHGQNKLKLVTHCQSEEYIFREYYLYKVFQLVSDYSFRVRLCRITYEDVNGEWETQVSYAFLIEPEKQLARRLGGDPLDDDISLRLDDVDREQLTRVHMFNYMAANRDFDVRIRQNIKVIAMTEGKPIAIPYDFDYSGIVNAEYTKDTDQVGQPVYEDRVRFKRLCRTEEEYQAVLDEFEAIEDDIVALYESSPYFSEESVDEILGYFQQFYRTSRKKKTMRNVFLKGCGER